MNRYLAHGLCIQSEWALPSGVLRAPDGHEPIDLSIQSGRVSLPPDSDPATRFFAEDPHSHTYHWPEIGSFQIFLDGRVVVDALHDAPGGLVEHILLGPVLADVFMTRKRLAMHASGVRLGSDTVAIVGPSGAGKSTLAAALVRNGARTHGDDLLNVCPKSGKTPFGTARTKLNADSLSALDYARSHREWVFEGSPKHALILPPDAQRLGTEAGVPAEAPRLSAIYRLVDSDSFQPEFVRLTAMKAALGLVMDVFMVDIQSQILGPQELFNRASTLSSKVPLFLLRRRKDLSCLAELAESLADHVRGLSSIPSPSPSSPSSSHATRD